MYFWMDFQAVPLFLSEIAPTRIRGGLNILFQLNVTIGILFANIVNYFTAKYVYFFMFLNSDFEIMLDLIWL